MPIEFFRGVVGVIGVACAWMAARNVVLIRRGRQEARRIYGWFARTLLCLVAVAIRHPIDAADFILWTLCAVAFAAGWWQTSHAKPPEDLSSEIFPDEP
jgi:hypothetical protein